MPQRRAKLPEGAEQKTLLPQETLAKLKMFDSSISPSGLLERLVIGWLYFNDKIAIKIAISQPIKAKRNAAFLA